MSSARLYVGHLSSKARERDVEELFSRYGRVREILLKNGFGFVEFDDARDAEEAVYRCNGKDLRGERIVVELTRRPPRGRDMYRSGGYGGGGGGGRYSSFNGRSGFNREPRRRDDNYPTQTRYRVIVENLSSRCSWQDLKDIMRSAGEVTYADAHRIKPGEGVVCYRRSEDLRRAMDTLDGKEVNGRRIKLIDGTRESSRCRYTRSRSRSRTRSRSRSSRKSSRSKSKSRSKSSKSRSRSKSKSASSRSRSRSASSKHSEASDAGAGGKANGDAAPVDGVDEKRSRSRSNTAERKRRHSSSASRSRSGSPIAKEVDAND